MTEHVDIIIRAIFAFCLLLIGARILGKQTISQMTNFDFIAAISLGSIMANLTFNTQIKVHHLVIAYTIFVLIILITAYISMKSQRARKLLAGNPTVVIENGKILENNMRKMRYTIDYLNQQLRERDVFNIHEVLFAILETNGTLTVLKKPQFRNVVKQDLHITSTPETRLPIELIMDGKLMERNLTENKLTSEWLQTELDKRHLKQEEVTYAVLAANGAVYMDAYKDHIVSPIDKE